MITVRPLRVEDHAVLVHDWLTRPYAHFWGMGSATLDEIRDGYRDLIADPHQDAWIGERAGRPVLLAETYDPAHSPLASRCRSGDLGMHFLTAPAEGSPEHGFTRAVIAAVMAHCFADPSVRRVVVEPDVGNRAVHALNEAVGFLPVAEIDLPDKQALFSVCERADFEATQAVMA